MNAPMKAIVDFAANNVPAEWAAIINATTFNPEFECEDMRQFKGAEPVMRNADAVVIAGVKYENITITPANGDEMPANEFFELINDNQ